MFLAEPAVTAYDLNFRLLGIRVRIAPWFWLVALLLGWDLTKADQQALLLTLWVGSVFLSILVHEMGHALAMRFYGIHSYIVLYQFGGLAIPEQYSSFQAFGARRPREDPTRQIVISAAGPVTQLMLALAIALSIHLSGYRMRMGVPYLEYLLPLQDGREIASRPLEVLLYFLMLTSVLWALLNLLPVYPLDGGQIARNVLTLFDPATGIRYSLILSIVTGAAVAVYAFTSRHDPFLGLMFGLLAYSSFQILQAYSGRGGGGGGW
ncbi:MAG: site-2 protease family protein [Planctomycetes bacterium]|nr:site-2 protease family protein [Planctomycetota bacterium]